MALKLKICLVIIALSLYFTGWEAACAVESGGNSQKSSQKAKGGGGGSGSASSNKDGGNSKISHSQVSEIASPKHNVKGQNIVRIKPTLRNVRKHSLACPTTFLKDGVYIWCDPDSLWTIFWKGREKFTVSATITAAKPVLLKSAVKVKTRSPKTQPNKLELTNVPNSRIGILQFTSTEDYVEFDILLDGKSDPNRIYVGSYLDNPKQFPLKLVTRRMLSHSGKIGVKLVENQKAGDLALSGSNSINFTKQEHTPTSPKGSKGCRKGNGKL